jgi:hypothetical protein
LTEDCLCAFSCATTSAVVAGGMVGGIAAIGSTSITGNLAGHSQYTFDLLWLLLLQQYFLGCR